ncbi:hypothetical protein RUESEDTHA_00848 [Ruegeria sp. THAF57]|nr:hypothetical protein RUESEDTHA_00848 [Ruegeria sp. THAF57]
MVEINPYLFLRYHKYTPSLIYQRVTTKEEKHKSNLYYLYPHLYRPSKQCQRSSRFIKKLGF